MDGERSASLEEPVDRQKVTLRRGILIALPIALAIWAGVYVFLPPLSGSADLLGRMIFTIKCCCVAALLCFVTGIEAVAHERLFSSAIDPLGGHESQRMKINLRYLQNTLEQLLVFILGLLGLAAYGSDADSMRAIVAATIVWIISRMAFWIGYHQGSQHRGAGLVGMAQSLIVLVYVCARFGYDIAGVVGATALLVLFGVMEACLVYMVRTPYRED